MLTLAQLRAKWFLDFGAGDARIPPSNRHAGSTVTNYTDGNLVEPLLEGDAYMKAWHDEIVRMHGLSKAEVYHAGWRMEDVRTLGQSDADSDALQVLKHAVAAGVDVKIMLSRHGGGAPSFLNRITSVSLILGGVRSACLDNRFPFRGSNHQKAVCLKSPDDPKVLLGSIDISATRWDTPLHRKKNEERHPKWGKPTHDTGVQIRGPAVADVERSFVERWNDTSRRFGLEPLDVPQPLITTPPSTPQTKGTHSVQVLHTYGMAYRFSGYSWSPTGEFTVWASYINAIKRATRYIYIEDQYFLPFDSPPLFASDRAAREFDIVWQLGEAVKRGVKVIVLVPNNAEDATHLFQQHQRDIGVFYLENVAAENGAAGGRFFAAWPEVDGDPVYVHSKLLIVDDEFVLIGSANVCQRSMTFDGELSVGVVDAVNAFAADLRCRIWAEQLDRSESSLLDPMVAYETFRMDAFSRRGRVRLYVPSAAKSPPEGHGLVMRQLVDPYGGPPRHDGAASAGSVRSGAVPA